MFFDFMFIGEHTFNKHLHDILLLLLAVQITYSPFTRLYLGMRLFDPADEI